LYHFELESLNSTIGGYDAEVVKNGVYDSSHLSGLYLINFIHSSEWGLSVLGSDSPCPVHFDRRWMEIIIGRWEMEGVDG
jgi:hypothetical protein